MTMRNSLTQFQAAVVVVSTLALAIVFYQLAALVTETESGPGARQGSAASAPAGSRVTTEPAPEEEIRKRDIFDHADASVVTIENEVESKGEELAFSDPNFIYGDHHETTDGQDCGMAKGDGLQWTSKGAGGGSNRGGGGYGGPFGGRKNLTIHKSHAPRSAKNKFDSIGVGSGAGRGGMVNPAAPFAGRRAAAAARDARFEDTQNETYINITENTFQNPIQDPLSTFSADVDTASYANIRRFLTQNNSLPPADAVRVEEMLNYFRYSDARNVAEAGTGNPFSVTMEAAACPWNEEHRLVRIGVHAKDIAARERKPANLTFLIDTSGSMSDDNKLSLLKMGLRLLVSQLTENDRVSIVTYSSEANLVLAPTPASDRDRILGAIEPLTAGGSTNGAGGIQLAYQQASASFIQDGVNRVLLMTDGDFNVGITDPSELKQFIAEKAKSGVFLSVLGFGMGNLKDATMEQLADRGNGNYSYIDTLREARKVLSGQINGTLVTVAKDVKLQLEFNPAVVEGYRLIGYEDRKLAAKDFNNDKKDAGEIGAGHCVTALYEIAPVAKRGTFAGESLKY